VRNSRNSTLHKIDTSTRFDADPTSAPTRAEVHLGRLIQNLDVFRRTAPSAEVMAVVKADAYGHGAPRVAAALSEAGVTWFAVATVPEGIRLRKSGVEGRILVLGAPLPDYIHFYGEYDLDITISSEEIAEHIIAAEMGPFRAHVKIETGMNRIGIPCRDAVRVVRRLEMSGDVRLEGLWTHFAAADGTDLDFSRRQLAQFNETIKPLEDAASRIHTANSAAALRLPETVQHPRALMRIGIGLYGYSALEGLAEDAGLRPVMTVTSQITHLKSVATGESVSYGRRWTADHPTRIATVGAGYADGYPRLLSNRGDVSIGGVRYPIAGTVCMDMFMVDVGTAADISVGDEVVLFGPKAPDAYQIAAWAETIPYEILTGVTARVPRVFVS
jgi:alanine racemase